MRAALVTGAGRLELVDVGEPRPAPSCVVVEVRYCGVCGSDVAAYRTGHLLNPAVCGHEWTGTVRAVGPDVTGLREGDRVVVGVAPPCGRCPECTSGRSATCRVAFAMLLGRDPAAPPHGGFARAIAVDAGRVVKADPALTDEEAAQVEPTAIAFRAVRRSGVGLGDTAVVQGAGPIGLLTLQVARAAGAGTVVVVEPAESRRELALQLGAHVAVPPGEEAARAVLEVTGGVGADVVFECAGAAPLVQTAVDLTRRGGVMAMIGFVEGTATIDAGAWIGKDVRVVASLGFAHEDVASTMRLIADGRVRVTPLHTRTVGLEGLEAAFADLAGGRSADVKVLVDPSV
ncbi:MAG: zinc-binding dehydrogenase [Acidimicrobiia bacterium]|nr:zinc-binding dehydrogenase [Acidimicrobiia bacterium]